jgi:hypothetical protein
MAQSQDNYDYYSDGVNAFDDNWSHQDERQQELNYARIRREGLWHSDEDPESPYCTEVCLKFYGAK